jgi:AsmA protein
VRIVKVLVYTVIGIAVLAGIAVGAAVAIVDGAFVKSRLEQAMKEKNRALAIEGVPGVKLFPVAGLSLGKTTLSEAGSERTFVALESMEVAVRVMPLLSGEVAVETLKLAGLKVNLVRTKDGRMNFDDLAGERREERAAGAGAPPRVRLAGASVERAEIAYRDEASGRSVEVRDLNFKAGRLDGAQPAPVELSLAVRGREPLLDVKASAAGAIKLDLAKPEIVFDAFKAQAAGRIDRDTLAAVLSAPKLEITPVRASGADVTGSVKISGPQRKLDAIVRIAAVEGSARALSIPKLAFEANGLAGGIRLSAKAEATVKADLAKERLEADLAAKLDESAIKAKLGLTKFAPLAATFDLAVDRIDLDRYFPPTKGPADPNARIELAALKGPTVTGKAQIGALTARRVNLQNVKAEVKLNNGRLDVAPHSAALYGGTLAGNASVDAASNRITLKENVQGVQIGPLLRDAAQQDRLEGRVNVNLDVAMTGTSAAALKRSMGGTARVELREGAVKGINLAEAIQDVRSVLGSKSAKANDPGKRTDFSEITGSFKIKNGIARNDDLQGKAPLLRLAGAGDVDIGGSRVDYTARVSLVATSKGQGGRDLTQLVGVTVPVKLTGALEKPDVSIDFGDVIAKSGAGIGRALGSAGGVRDKIKGLFGR